MQNRRTTFVVLITAAIVAAGVMLYRWWFRPPAIEYDNLRYVQLLTTAVSARNTEWLGKVEQAVEAQHQAGAMSEVELSSMTRIIAIAAAGDWSTADVECFELAEAQLGRRRIRPPTDEHDHEH